VVNRATTNLAELFQPQPPQVASKSMTSRTNIYSLERSTRLVNNGREQVSDEDLKTTNEKVRTCKIICLSI